VLVQKKIGCLQDAINTLTKRKTCKRQYIRVGKTLIVSKVTNLIAEKEGSNCKEGKTPTKRVCIERSYGYYSETRYNSYTYKVEIEDVENSNAFKQCYSITYSIVNYCNIARRYYVGVLLLKVAYSLR
jgi:hypothetical protein